MRRGQALLAVLMLLSLAATLGMVAGMSGRDAVMAVHNRADARRASAMARGCAAELLSALVESYNEAPDEVWPILGDGAVTLGQPIFDCDIQIASANRRLDIDLVDRETLTRGIAALIPQTEAARYATLILAEHARLGRVGTLDELLHGVEPSLAARLTNILSVRTGPVDLMHADTNVLAALPGIGPEGARAILDRRSEGRLPQDVREVLWSAADASQYPALARLAVLTPLAWELRATAREGARKIAAIEEWHIVRAEGTLAVAARVVW